MTINKKTPLVGKAGPDKRKREDDQKESILDDQRFATRKQIQDVFSLVGQLVKNTNPQKENQEQGRQGDRDHGSFKERENYRRQGGWAANNNVEAMANNGNMQILQLPLDINMGSQGRSTTNVGQRRKLERGFSSLHTPCCSK